MKRVNIQVLHQSVWYLYASHSLLLTKDSLSLASARVQQSRGQSKVRKEKKKTLKDHFSWRRSWSQQVQLGVQDIGHTKEKTNKSSVLSSVILTFENAVPFAHIFYLLFFLTPAGVNKLILVLQFRCVCFRFFVFLGGDNNYSFFISVSLLRN